MLRLLAPLPTGTFHSACAPWPCRLKAQKPGSKHHSRWLLNIKKSRPCFPLAGESPCASPQGRAGVATKAEASSCQKQSLTSLGCSLSHAWGIRFEKRASPGPLKRKGARERPLTMTMAATCGSMQGLSFGQAKGKTLDTHQTPQPMEHRIQVCG